MKTISFSLFISLFLTFSTNAQEASQLTWTYTYLKAESDQEDQLKEFLISNWLVMDSIAVSQGLFKDYHLLENLSEEATRDWDFIVAVEYFTRGTYADIQAQWQEIRKSHKKVLINGKDFPQLGRVVRSEVLNRSNHR